MKLRAKFLSTAAALIIYTDLRSLPAMNLFTRTSRLKRLLGSHVRVTSVDIEVWWSNVIPTLLRLGGRPTSTICEVSLGFHVLNHIVFIFVVDWLSHVLYQLLYASGCLSWYLSEVVDIMSLSKFLCLLRGNLSHAFCLFIIIYISFVANQN